MRDRPQLRLYGSPEVQFQNNKLMFRVLFRVRTVQLRLKEQVQVQVAIKKGHENFVIPCKAKLIDGTATFETHIQFFLCKSHPCFDIYVMMLAGSLKKFAGMCQVDLNSWQQNSNMETTCHLLKSPDSTATIVFSYIFMSSDVQAPKKLLSVSELESLRKSEYIKQMEDKYSYLTSQNMRLNEEVAYLKQEKRVLIHDKESMCTQHTKTSLDYERRLKNQFIEIEHSQNNLVRMKQTMEKVESIVNMYGEPDLKQKVGHILETFGTSPTH